MWQYKFTSSSLVCWLELIRLLSCMYIVMYHKQLQTVQLTLDAYRHIC